MAQADQNADQPHGVGQARVAQPAQCIVGINQVRGPRNGWKVRPAHIQRVPAPREHHHDHDRRDIHDAQSFLARLVNAFDVLPPEINRDERRKDRSSHIYGQNHSGVRVMQKFVQETNQIQPRGDAADGPSQDVVKHQSGDGNFGQRAAHRLFDDAVHTAAHKHAAALDVDGAHRVGQAHDRQNEPRASLPNKVFRNGAGVKGGRPHVIQDNCRGTPEGHEREHGRCRN